MTWVSVDFGGFLEEKNMNRGTTKSAQPSSHFSSYLPLSTAHLNSYKQGHTVTLPLICSLLTLLIIL